jgi:hypothetical protein
MLIYLDMCCLKRPFDDQSQPRIRLETEAVLGLLGAESAEVRFVRSPALLLENSRNPVTTRAARVAQWLQGGVLAEADPNTLEKRTGELMTMGLRNFDALHLASAECAGADIMGSCDDHLLATAARNCDRIRVRVVGVVELAKEVLR